MTEVTDKMVKAAVEACNLHSIWQKTENDFMRVAIEAALAARKQVDVGELVRKLSKLSLSRVGLSHPIIIYAVDAIEDLVVALKPFAEYADLVKKGSVNWVPDGCPVTANPASHEYDLTVGDIRRANAALARIGVKL